MQIYSVVSEMFEEIINDDDNDDGRQMMAIAYMAYG